MNNDIHHEKQNNGRALHTGVGVWGIYCMQLNKGDFVLQSGLWILLYASSL